MLGSHDAQSPASAAIHTALFELHGRWLDAAAIAELAETIRPFLARSRLPLEDAVRRISTNYLHDHTRVHHLLTTASLTEWQQVLVEVIAFVGHRSHYPRPLTEKSHHQLFEAIRHQLAAYNFESPLDRWLAVTLLRQLHRG